jgi:hypothetical protein
MSEQHGHANIGKKSARIRLALEGGSSQVCDNAGHGELA